MDKNTNNSRYIHFCTPQRIQKDFNNIIGIIEGVMADDVLQTEEVEAIINWLLSTKIYENQSPYKQLTSMLSMAIEDYHISVEERNDIIWFCKNYLEQNQYFDLITAKIQELHGLLEALSFDSILYDVEIDFLENWLNNHSFLQNTYPFDFVCNQVYIIKHENVSESDKLEAVNKILELGRCFESSKLGSTNSNAELVEHLKTDIFLSPKTEIDFNGKYVCVTGESKEFRRAAIHQILESKGAIIIKAVSGKIDYLIICEHKSNCWAFATYGRKVEKVIELKNKGTNVEVVFLEDLFGFFKND
jgi:NAD-dependent DNA ligase